VKVPGLVSPSVRAVEKSLETIGGLHACERPPLLFYEEILCEFLDKGSIIKSASAGHEIS
jgi:hypothetical protein